MTDRPILDISLDTSAFEAFRAKFDAYRAKAAETTGAWTDIGKTTQATAQTFDKMASSLARMQAALSGIEQQTEDAGQEQEASSERWTHIASSARVFGSNIKDASLSLAKWSGLTGLFAGILSAGGLYGISRMAAGVGARRSQAMSYGSSYGEFQSYQTNFARLGNAGGLLAGFNEAMTNAESRAPLYALMGAGADKRLAGKTAAGALAEALPDIKRFVDRTDPRNLAGALHGTGIDRLGVDMNTALAIRAMSPQELGQISQDFASDHGGMKLSPELAKNWQDFDTALDHAGAEIENHFATNLVNLAPSLTLLANGLSDVVDHMLKDGGPAEKWLASANKGIEGFAESIGKKETLGKIDHFVKDVGAIGRVISQMVALHGKNGDGAASLGGIVPDDAKEGWNHSKANRYMNWLFGLNSSTPEQNQRASARESRSNPRKGRRGLGQYLGMTPEVKPEDADQSTWGANYGFLKEHASGGATRPGEIDALHPAQAAKMAEMIRWTKENLGYDIGILSAARRAGQTGSMFDNSGMSAHPEGVAGDFDLHNLPASAYDRWAEHARSIGLFRPWGSQQERNHWQIIPDKHAPASFNAVDLPKEERLRRQNAIYPIAGVGDPEGKLSPVKPLHPHHQGQTNTVHVDDETGAADVHRDTRAVGPMSYGTDFGRFNH